MQKQFEYILVHIKENEEKTVNTLNEYGQKGWELVQVDLMSFHYFKRLIE